jgi:hypothetical protein
VEDVLSSVYKPLADRVEATVGGLQADFERLDSGSDDSVGLNRILDRFESEAAPDLDVMLEVGDLPGYAEEHARDTAAELVRSISIASWNRGQDVELAKRASAMATRYADSSALQAKIKEDADFLKTAKPLDKRAAALRAAALSAMKSGLSSEAIKCLENLLYYLQRLDDPDRNEIRQVRSALATALHNRAIEIAAPERTGEMRRLLSRALELEPDEGDRAIIRRTLSQVPSAGQKVATQAAGVVVGLIIQLLGLGFAILVMGLIAAGLSQCR